MKRRGAALLATALLGGAAVACPLPEKQGWQHAAPQGAVRLAWRAPPIVAGEMFAVQIALCPAQARLLAVDATMPEHGHGMNYATRLLALPGGRWRADGLLWHMSGRWELRFDVDLHGEQHSLRHSVQLR